MAKNRIVKNYIYNVFYQILVLLTPLITTPYVSRVLGTAGVGEYSYTQSIATYFVLMGTVGSSLYGQREVAYVQNDAEARSRIFFELVILRAVTVAIALIPYILIFACGDSYSLLYTILIFEIVAAAFDISWFFQGMENFAGVVVRNTIIKIIAIAATFIFVKDSGDVPLYTVCMTFPTLIGNMSLWPYMRNYVHRVHLSAGDVLIHIKPLLILFVPQIAVEIYAVLDRTMIGALTGNVDEVGLYTQAQKIIKIILKLVTSLGTVMLPAMSAAFVNNEKEKIQRNIGLSIQYVGLSGFPLMFGILAVSDIFVPLFFGSGFEKVSLLMNIISPIVIFIGLSNVLGLQYLLPVKKQKEYTVSVFSGMVINIIFNILLIPKFLSIGASIASVAAEFTVFAVQLLFVRKELKVLKPLAGAFKYCLYGMVMYGVIYFVKGYFEKNWFSLIILCLIGAIIYFIILLITRDKLCRLLLKKLVNRRKA